MEKVRVHEIAKELGITSKEVVRIGSLLRIDVKTASSTVSMEEAETIVNVIMSDIDPIQFLKDSQVQNTNIHYSTSKDITSSADQLKSIDIEITDLKSILHLKWSIPFQKGIHIIISENGSGKSSLIISLAKLVQPAVLTNEFIGKGFEKSVIKYSLNNKFYTWQKRHGWVQINSSDRQMPKLEGFFESSVHTGTRFKKINHNIKDIEIDTQKYGDVISDADIFIQQNMNYILYGDKIDLNKFTNLVYIKISRKRLSQDKKKYEDYIVNFYALQQDTLYIKEYFFSTGEYFLLSLLKFINSFRYKARSGVTLIIIDEIELSLHPLAQKRLMEKISEFSEMYNILFIFATHSLQVIEHVEPSCIHYLENKNGICAMSSPIYPSYLTSKLYVHNSFDYVLLVEDNLSKIYIEQIVRKNIKSFSFNFIILPIGGWGKLYEMHTLNHNHKIYGSAKTKIVFDGDVKFINEANTSKYQSIPKIFLPFGNLEKLVVSYLEQQNNEFMKFFNSYVYGKTFEDLKLNICTDNTDAVKKTFKKFVTIFSQFASCSDDSITEKIIEQVIKQNLEKDESMKFKKNIIDFLNS